MNFFLKDLLDAARNGHSDRIPQLESKPITKIRPNPYEFRVVFQDILSILAAKVDQGVWEIALPESYILRRKEGSPSGDDSELKSQSLADRKSKQRDSRLMMEVITVIIALSLAAFFGEFGLWAGAGALFLGNFIILIDFLEKLIESKHLQDFLEGDVVFFKLAEEMVDNYEVVLPSRPD